MSGGQLLTGIPENIKIGSALDEEGTIIPEVKLVYKMTGALLNPALAFGTQIISLDFSYGIQYTLMPFAGALTGFLFHEFVFKRTQQILNVY